MLLFTLDIYFVFFVISMRSAAAIAATASVTAAAESFF